MRIPLSRVLAAALTVSALSGCSAVGDVSVDVLADQPADVVSTPPTDVSAGAPGDDSEGFVPIPDEMMPQKTPTPTQSPSQSAAGDVAPGAGPVAGEVTAPRASAYPTVLADPVSTGGKPLPTERPKLRPRPTVEATPIPAATFVQATPKPWPSDVRKPDWEGTYLQPMPEVTAVKPVPRRALPTTSAVPTRVKENPGKYALPGTLAGAKFWRAAPVGQSATTFTYTWSDPLTDSAVAPVRVAVSYEKVAADLRKDGWVEVAIRSFPLHQVGQCPGAQELGQFARDNQLLTVDVRRSVRDCPAFDNAVNVTIASRWDQ